MGVNNILLVLIAGECEQHSSGFVAGEGILSRNQHFFGAVAGEVLLYSLSYLGFISADHYEEFEGSEDQSLALNYEGR